LRDCGAKKTSTRTWSRVVSRAYRRIIYAYKIDMYNYFCLHVKVYESRESKGLKSKIELINDKFREFCYNMAFINDK
jgi:hypothetical protein